MLISDGQYKTTLEGKIKMVIKIKSKYLLFGYNLLN